MPTYIGLLRYTSEGVKGIKDRWKQGNPNDKARQAAKAMGCELKGAYVTMGRYDGVAIIEAPNDETMAKLALATGMGGVWQTETLRAFTESEIEKIVASDPTRAVTLYEIFIAGCNLKAEEQCARRWPPPQGVDNGETGSRSARSSERSMRGPAPCGTRPQQPWLWPVHRRPASTLVPLSPVRSSRPECPVSHNDRATG